jgi:hypothetical protein
MHPLSITVSPTKRLPTEQVWTITSGIEVAAATSCWLSILALTY